MAFLFCSNTFATTSVVVVAKDAIVVGIDSQSRTVSNSGFGASGGPVRKSFVLQNSLVIACIGMGSYTITNSVTKQALFSYDAVDFINRVKLRLPPNSSIQSAAEIVKKQAEKVVLSLSPYVTNGTIKKEDTPQYLVQYILVTYNSKIPTIMEVHVGFDWEKKHLTGPFINPVYPPGNGGSDVPIRFYGESAAIRKINNPGSYEQNEAVANCQVVAPVLRGELPLLTEAEDLAAYLISLEIKVDPRNVGLPIRLVVLPLTGRRPTIILRRQLVSKCGGDKK